MEITVARRTIIKTKRCSPCGNMRYIKDTFWARRKQEATKVNVGLEDVTEEATNSSSSGYASSMEGVNLFVECGKQKMMM